MSEPIEIADMTWTVPDPIVITHALHEDGTITVKNEDGEWVALDGPNDDQERYE